MELTEFRQLFEKAATERGLSISVREKGDRKNPVIAIMSRGSTVVAYLSDAGTRDLNELVNERLGALERKLALGGAA